MQVTGCSRQILMKIEYSRRIFEKYSNIKFHENPSSGLRVVPCGRTDGRTDMTKLTDTFRNFANAPKNEKIKNTCDLKTWAFYPFGRNFKRQRAE